MEHRLDAGTRQTVVRTVALLLMGVGAALLFFVAPRLDGSRRGLVSLASAGAMALGALVGRFGGVPDAPPQGGELPPQEQTSEPPTRKMPRWITSAVFGVTALGVAAMVFVMDRTLFQQEVVDQGEDIPRVLLFYSLGLAAFGVALLVRAFVLRRKDGPAPPGPYESWASRDYARVVVANAHMAWVGPLSSFGAMAAAAGLGLALGGWGTAYAYGWGLFVVGLSALLVAGVLTWRDERTLGRPFLSNLLYGFGFAALGYGGLLLTLSQRTEGELPRGLGLWMLGAGVAATLAGWQLRRNHASAADAQPAAPEDGHETATFAASPPMRSGAFWLGFLLILPALVGTFAAAGLTGVSGVSCMSGPTELPNGATNVTVQMASPPDEVPDPLDVFPPEDAQGMTPFTVPANTSFIRLRLEPGVELQVQERRPGGDWTPATGGGADEQDGFQPYGRADFSGYELRVSAQAPPERHGTSQVAYLVFSSEEMQETCG